MKIIHINSARKLIGEAAHTADLTEQLNLHGHDAKIVLRGDSVYADFIRNRGLPVAAELAFATGFKPKSLVRDVKQLRRLILTEKPDVIHCHRGNDHGMAVAALTGLDSKAAVVRTRHRVHKVDNEIVNRWLFERRTDAIIAVSQQAAASFRRMRPLVDHKLTTVYSSVDTERFNPKWRCNSVRAELGVADDEKLVGLIARFQGVKGQEMFLQAAAKVLKVFPRTRFLLAGSGSAQKKEQYEKLCSELGIEDRVIIRNWLGNINEVTASLDVGVLASRSSEGSSRVTYEYMASGVPAVATAVGCIPEVMIDGSTGYIIPPRDSDAMAEAIISLLKSPETSARISSQAREYVQQHHTRERWVGDIVKVYEQAIQRRQHDETLNERLRGYARIFWLAKPIQRQPGETG